VPLPRPGARSFSWMGAPAANQGGNASSGRTRCLRTAAAGGTTAAARDTARTRRRDGRRIRRAVSTWDSGKSSANAASSRACRSNASHAASAKGKTNTVAASANATAIPSTATQTSHQRLPPARAGLVAVTA
jgi:hypothetical protein